MPHDKNGSLLQVGDRVLLDCRIKSIDSNEEQQCNVTAEAIERPEGEGFIPTLCGNSRFYEKVPAAITRPLARYRCHKEVGAVKIKEISAVPNSIGPSWLIVPEEGGIAPIEVTHAWYEKHVPHAGGYYVDYEDGYKSFSPAEAFEKGYRLIADCPEPSAYDKLMQLAACVERAKFALGLKGFFDPAQTEISGLIDEVLGDVPFVDESQPVWWREPDEATVERAAKAGYDASFGSEAFGAAIGSGWDDVPESGKGAYRAAARAIMAFRK